MRPGTRAPFYGGMSRPGFMGQQLPSHMGPMNRAIMRPMSQGMMRPMRPAQYQMGASMGRSQPARKGGGILAKILGKGSSGGSGVPSFNLGGAVGGAGRASGGGILQSLTNPGAINGFLNNTQQVLKTAQSVGPMIQQYGPLVKNLPSMWKLYRSLQDLPDHDEETVVETEVDTEMKKPAHTAKNTSQTVPVKKTSWTEGKESKPKLFF